MRGLKIILAAVAMLAIPAGIAQQTTEKFIPIGMSPGISNKMSFQGDLVAVDAAARSISMQFDGATRNISVTADTHIWLDRSKAKKPNADGSFSDLKVGRRVEVMYQMDNQSQAAWIKIESQ